MKLADLKSCSGCTACYAVCPKSAITMAPDEHGFLFPQINEVKCVSCGFCEKTCPVLHPGEPDKKPIVYAARTKDLDLRLASSSGGIFTELAKPILSQGGVVFGCILEKGTVKAIHAKAETLDELAAMRGSKYVQSDLRNTLREAKVELEKWRQVLFSGTPCQIAGLNHFLGKKYDNLLTVELICHSVPAPNLFERLKKSLGNPETLVFRSKTGQNQVFVNSFFARAFFNYICSRLSCYNCSAKQSTSGADVTIGDFWGVEKMLPQLNAKEGVSIILCHTEKSAQSLASIESSCDLWQVDATHAFDANPYYLRSTPLSPARSYFMARYQSADSLDKLVTRAINGPWIAWLVKKISRKFKRVLYALNAK